MSEEIIKCQPCELGTHDQCLGLFNDGEGKEQTCKCKGTEEHDKSVVVELEQFKAQMGET